LSTTLGPRGSQLRAPGTNAAAIRLAAGGGAAAAAAFAGIVGTGIAIAASQNRRDYYDSYGYYDAPQGYYGGGPAYVADPGYDAPCVWQRQRFWDGYGWRVRRVRVCD